MDLNRRQFSIEFAGKPLVIEVSNLAEQATAAVLGRYDETAVLVTVVMAEKDRPVDFFPLIVDYEERFYAAGKIIGSRFVRREGRPSEEAVLSGRIIDRTIRPLFDHRLRREVQVVVTILSIDEKSDPDFIALLTASVALSVSKIPWDGPVAGVKIVRSAAGEFIVNPAGEAALGKDWNFAAFIAGTGERINMMELDGREAAEEEVVRACAKAQEAIKKLADWQETIVREIGQTKAVIDFPDLRPEAKKRALDFLKSRLGEAIYIKSKTEREAGLAVLKDEFKKTLTQEFSLSAGDEKILDHFFEEQVDAAVHRGVLDRGERPDGRGLEEVRPLHGETGILKRTHGSAIFVRGNTQALAVTTLGPPNAEQLVETIEFTGKRRFLLHYNFPPYSVGETGPFRGPGRREIGHGALAGKALKNIIPDADRFPYTIRVVSEILSSNGSSSMATVCAASLSMMDAGVPIKKPVAGIAMGLMLEPGGEPGGETEGRSYKILTDIQGPEDHYGDMDFKVAGTRDGITALQLDVKISGLTLKMIEEALSRAKTARLHVLEAMNKVLPASRPELSPYAPVIATLDIPPSKIGEVIGPGGKIINGIIADTGALAIDIEESGRVYVTGSDKESAKAAIEIVKSIVKTYEVGEIVEGEVVKILDFGAIVQLNPHQDGMIHVSELKNGFVKNVSDVLKLHDRVRAKVIRSDPDGRIGLSLKNLDPAPNRGLAREIP